MMGLVRIIAFVGTLLASVLTANEFKKMSEKEKTK